MALLAHHIEVELFDLIHIHPETPLDHAVAFGVSGLLLLLIIYGAYAMVRDLGRWQVARKRAATRS
jgi:hypothetical protein